jgi:hypothetical protein
MLGSFAASEEENCRMPLEMWNLFCGRLILSSRKEPSIAFTYE